MTRAIRKGAIVTLVALGAVGLAAGVAYRLEAQARAEHAARLLQARRAAWDRLEQAIRREAAQFSGEAGIVVEDLTTGWQLAHQPTARFAAASMIKVPIMTACFEAAQRGTLSLAEPIQLRGADQVGGSGVLKAEKSGGTYTVAQLIELMITRSDNTATNILIKRLGYEELNRSFARAGLSQTSLVRPMMDFSQRRRGVDNFTSAQDMADSIRGYYRGTVVSREFSRKGMDLLKAQLLRDRIPAKLPAGVLVAHKTGLERHVVHDAGVIYTPRGDILVSVLTKLPAANKAGSRPAKQFIARLSRLAYDYLMQAEARAP